MIYSIACPSITQIWSGAVTGQLIYKSCMYKRKSPQQAEKKMWVINHLLSTIKTSSTQRICRQLQIIKKLNVREKILALLYKMRLSIHYCEHPEPFKLHYISKSCGRYARERQGNLGLSKKSTESMWNTLEYFKHH